MKTETQKKREFLGLNFGVDLMEKERRKTVAPLQTLIENLILGKNNSVQTLELIVKFTYDLSSLSVFQSKCNRHLEA